MLDIYKDSKSLIWIGRLALLVTTAFCIWGVYEHSPIAIIVFLFAIMAFIVVQQWIGPVAFLVIVAGYLNAFALILSLYDRLHWSDLIIHGYTSFAFAIFLGSWFMQHATAKYKFANLVVIVALGIAIGTLWEVLEFYTFKYIIVSIKDIAIGDTITDLIADTIGSLLAGYIIVYKLPALSPKVPLWQHLL